VVADEVDRKIIAELQVNGRASWTEIAERVGLSVPAVARRGQHLFASGAVRVGIMPCYHVQAAGQLKDIRIVCAPGTQLDVAATLVDVSDRCAARRRAHDGVRYIAASKSSPTLFCEMILPTVDMVHQFLTQDLATMEGVRSWEAGSEPLTFKRGFIETPLVAPDRWPGHLSPGRLCPAVGLAGNGPDRPVGRTGSALDRPGKSRVREALPGIAEILRNPHDPERGGRIVGKVKGADANQGGPAQDRRPGGPVARATGLGSALGVLPGGGHVLASFGSHALEKRLSKRPQDFGKGAIEGVAGPEGANNAAAQTAFIPLLTLGLPANGVMTLIAGALILQVIPPGPGVIEAEPELVWGGPDRLDVDRQPAARGAQPAPGRDLGEDALGPLLGAVPAIVTFACIGTYTIRGNLYEVLAIVLFGALGYVTAGLEGLGLDQ
jgi:hypothetical protein